MIILIMLHKLIFFEIPSFNSASTVINLTDLKF